MSFDLKPCVQKCARDEAWPGNVVLATRSFLVDDGFAGWAIVQERS